jgi:hypothetical protein
MARQAVTGFFKPAPSPKANDWHQPMIGTTRQKLKILAAHRYIFSVNALILSRPAKAGVCLMGR